MDSHTFSDPIPIPDPSAHDAYAMPAVPQPCWKVHVLRRDAVRVGTLLVHNGTVPPRKRKGKIVWRLPDSLDQAPRFGEHEKKVLWELFKQQKKERRKQLKQSPSGRDEDDNDDDEEEETQETTAEGVASLSLPVEEYAMKKNETASQASPTRSAAQQLAKEQKALTPVPPLPPGFEGAVPSQQQQKQPHAARPLRPPPGIGAPPGMTPSVAPAPAAGVTRSSPPLVSHHFQIPQEAPLAVLGTLIAQTFVQSMSLSSCSNNKNSADKNVNPWLHYYHHAGAVVVKTLLVGSAQAVCTTPAERQQQWQSLLQPGAVWECHGWTVQPVVGGGDDVAAAAAITNRNHPSQVLAVLTGRTLQPGTGWLAYTLTLLLVLVQGEEEDTTATSTTSTTGTGYSIVNDVLTLFALPPVAAAAPGTATMTAE